MSQRGRIGSKPAWKLPETTRTPVTTSSANTPDNNNKEKHQRKWKFGIATYNVRTLLGEEKLEELETALEQSGIHWDVIGLSEVRRKDESFQKLNSGHHFYSIGGNESQAGVGFLIHRTISNNIIEIKGINERLAAITIRINKKYTLKIIQVYAPTSTHKDDEIEELYDEIDKLLQTKTQYTIVMGDFNCKVGRKQEEEDVVGEFGGGERNDRGENLVEFATAHNLKIMNTFF
jgi:hypothetical protein